MGIFCLDAENLVFWNIPAMQHGHWSVLPNNKMSGDKPSVGDVNK